MTRTAGSAGLTAAAEEVCRLTADLIRIDTTNRGSGDAVGESRAAELVADLLSEVDLTCRSYERASGRTNLVCRWGGRDPALPALLLHGHLDVVPADSGEWSVDPFAGVVRDGMIWGRGAVDMKNMIAMIVTSVRTLLRNGFTPERDIVLAFLADEEDNSEYGARWLVDDHPEVFAGVDTAISEVGGFSVPIRDRPVFLVQTGEKGILWLRLRAGGRAGHASQVNTDSAVNELARAIVRIADARWPVTLTSTSRRLVDQVRELAGLPADAAPVDVLQATGPCAPFIVPSLFTVANVTMVNAGCKQNVVPGDASAVVDVRVLPGERDDVLQQIRELAGPGVEVCLESEAPAVEAPFDEPIVRAMQASLTRHLPEARIAPYLLPAGSDNAMLAPLGIRGYGFVPLLLPPDYDFPAMFHGVDERIPIESLVFGQLVLQDLIASC